MNYRRDEAQYIRMCPLQQLHSGLRPRHEKCAKVAPFLKLWMGNVDVDGEANLHVKSYVMILFAVHKWEHSDKRSTVGK